MIECNTQADFILNELRGSNDCNAKFFSEHKTVGTPFAMHLWISIMKYLIILILFRNLGAWEIQSNRAFYEVGRLNSRFSLKSVRDEIFKLTNDVRFVKGKIDDREQFVINNLC